ncbi:MAG: DUF3179 domain-containing protein, partial [Candidatus Competibacteraceae bacterium]|nr:DUF3179 domain-containing protein [Candidatus Competibacteraceae bacterium]
MAILPSAARWFIYPATLVIALILLWDRFPPIVHSAENKNGFDLTEALIPAQEILSGGPARDGIPAIDNPVFVSAQQADYLEDDDRVLGIARNGVAKAYPIPILNWHEIVNDRVGEEPIAITFCPLCGTGMAFEATVNGKVRSFGVSGLLYNSDVLLYDRESESLWSQIARQAVSGPMKGTELAMVPASHTSWRNWRDRYPETQVLSQETGHRRNYDRNPYADYEQSSTLFFPVAHSDKRYHPKERVIGLTLNDQTKAYPFVELAKSS